MRRGGQPRPTPHGGPANHGQPPYRVGHPRSGRLQGLAGCGRQLKVGHPRLGPLQGAATRKWAAGYWRGANTKAACGQKHCPLVVASPQGAACPRRGCRGPTPTEASPTGTVTAAGAAADGQGQPPPVQGQR
ncbi:hypothetical protein BHE74_00042205 [Ensete ventricosum]|nr:hypothetical protein BHE74_00042205 [Ensete ventricosum]RZS26477.1 hypothetical protein BHM03_00059826 [Ensete ventricosum]